MSEISRTERVPDEELDQMIWKLERDGMTPKQLSLMRELREVRRAKGEPVAWTSQRSLEVRDKITAFTCKESADNYGMKSAWEDVVPLYTAPPAPNFREISNSSTKNFREISEASTNCPKCGGRGTYHCPQMLGTVECECTLSAAPKEVG